ncbi:MAG: hypothetical protein CMJ83_12965 [Planctomycetes bacterium]|nr:hypothetical protein [Planctomycetota bacterium]
MCRTTLICLVLTCLVAAQPPKPQGPKVQTTPPPTEATVLFRGKDVSAWVREKGGDPGWKVADGVMTIEPKSGSIMTRKSYGDFRMHLEFLVPKGAKGNGNSGVYIQRRYEVQILESHGLEPKPHHCGALYRYRKPDASAALPGGSWQSFDLWFRAPRWKADGTKTEDARITVIHNGLTVHHREKLTRKTGAGKKEGPKPQPILLQDHGAKVRFRNIWIQELADREIRKAMGEG